MNVLVHGHVPVLSDMIAQAAGDPELIKLAKEKGASGITVAGICCTALEVLIRRGVPVAGNFLQQELALVTGVVEMLIVDLQCVMPSLPNIAGNFHTKVISTSPGPIFRAVNMLSLKKSRVMKLLKS